MFHIASVYEKILVRCFFSCGLRFSDEACDVTYRGFDVDRKDVLVKFLSENIDDAMPQTAVFEIKELCPVTVECKVYFWIYKDNAFE